MQISVGSPATIPGARGDLILDWARRADAGPFASLGIIDRVVYPNHESLITLAAAAGATRRIRLMTSVLIAPLRRVGILAKQAATLDSISGGRLTLGLGVGGREDDYRAAPAPFTNRGRRFEEQLATMKRIWSGQPLASNIGPVGPPPSRAGGPELLIGGYSPVAVRRAGHWADGFISGGLGAAQARPLYDMVAEEWRAAGRPGRPRFVGATYFGLGENAAERAGAYIQNYYAFLGPMAETMARAVPSSVDAVKGVIQTFIDAGADELVLWPCIPDLDQVDRLADIVS